jgi:uncharacterized protein (TIGR03905 family)
LKYEYKTKDTCSSRIRFDIDDDIIRNVAFTGGCNGNLQAIPRLVDGLTVTQIEEKCRGILCGSKSTSCADQLAIAVREAYEARRNTSGETEDV